ncbi:hypothetical protein JCM12294_31960 [Desulfocicer niacini]
MIMGSSVLDNLWVIVSSVLVFLMQPGFMCLESGLTRSKNSINVAIKNLADFVFSVMGFWLLGFGLMFGMSQSGLIGISGFMADFGDDFHLSSFFLFQTMFCGTATTIFSGAVAERMRFSAYLIVVILLSVFIYPIFGHWAWNGIDSGNPSGWLGAAGFIDFAGSTVVHSVGGWVALATLIVVGSRKGRFDGNGKPVEIHGSNLPLSVLGTLLLWIGWIGFNGGSTLTIDRSVPGIIVNTVMAGAAGAVSALFAGLLYNRIAKTSYLINGSLGGLVAVTACCHCVTIPQAIFVGAIAGGVCLVVEEVLLYYGIDDAVGAVPVHLGCGVWGTLAVALLGAPSVLQTGLDFYSQLLVQVEGIAAAFVLAFVIPLFIIRRIDRMIPLRVSAHSEEIGLNISEHGAKTETADFFRIMQLQEETGDLSLRVPVDPFTDTGVIAARYNKVMMALENAIAGTEAIVSVAKDAIITFAGDDFRVMSMNPSGCAMFGYDGTSEVFSGLRMTHLFDTDSRGFRNAGEDPLNSEGKAYNHLDGSGRENHGEENALMKALLSGCRMEITGKKYNGKTFPMDAVVTRAVVGDESFHVGIFRDITIPRQKEEEISRQKAYFQQLFDGSPQAVISTDINGNIIRVNRGFELLFGYSAHDISHQKNCRIIVPDDLLLEMTSIRQTILSGNTVHKETRRKHREDRAIPVSLLGFPILINGMIEGLFFVYQDITQRKELEAQLYRKAFYDSLTGVPNRILFMERLGQAVARQRRKPNFHFAVFMIDLDRFKWVNDTLGHSAGDILLEKTAQRFLTCVRSMDTVARIGGDEFAVLLEDIGDSKEIMNIARRMKEQAAAIFNINGNDVSISSSIGIVINTSLYHKSEDILRDADIAMYRAKAMGKSRCKVFSRKLHKITHDALQLENDLREVVDRNELVLYYQPQVCAKTERIRGFEALLRWDHPQRGLVSPGAFIPLAEDTGLIIPIGQWVIQQACRQLKTWHTKLPQAQGLSMSVNISPRQFMHNDLGETLRNALESVDLSPHFLIAELTESAVMEKPESVIGQLNRLKETGIRIAIDDFGTGYSSLAYLRRFPLDYLKMDKRFVDDINKDHENLAIAKAIIALAHNLNLEVIAEGIERVEQLETLRGLKCDYIQGFFYSRPVDDIQAAQIIKSRFHGLKGLG